MTKCNGGHDERKKMQGPRKKLLCEFYANNPIWLLARETIDIELTLCH